MTTAKWTSIQESNRTYAIMLQDLMKRSVCKCEVEMLLVAHLQDLMKRGVCKCEVEMLLVA
jgi:hypothetical protein